MLPLVLATWRHAALTTSLAAGHPALAESPHFTLYRFEPGADRPGAEVELVVVHHFGPAQIDNNLGFYVAEELLPLLQAARGGQEAGRALDDAFAYDEHTIFEYCVGALVRSIDGNERRAWQHFYRNTLALFEEAMSAGEAAPGFIGPFGIIYAELLRLARGSSLLDMGTCFGFMPMLFARRAALGRATPFTTIVGGDLESALVNLANEVAQREGLQGLQFVQANLLSEEVVRLGRFDTVTLVHVLEHLEPQQTMMALRNLWQLTERRLIVTVPIEPVPDPRFGHLQVFDPQRLLDLGRELGGHCRSFALHGAWLVVDR